MPDSLPPLSEKAFMAQVVALARLCGWLVYHPHNSKHSPEGFPDLVLVKGGRVIFAELKTDRGLLRKSQQAWLDALACTRAEVYLWRPKDWDTIQHLLSED